DEDLRIGEQSATQRNEQNRGRGAHHQQNFVAANDPRQKRQIMRQRLVQQGVVQDDFQRQRLQQVRGGDAQSAHARQKQSRFDPAQVRPKNLTQSFSFSRLHTHPPLRPRTTESPVIH